MAKNRKIPFGYKIENGRISVHPEESAVVVQLFENYLSGKSLQEVSDLGQILYPEYPNWNFSQVWYLLSNQKYLGTEVYPRLIEPEIFEAVQKLRTSKAVTSSRPPEHIIEIRKLTVCSDCGSKVYRYGGVKHGGWTCGRSKSQKKSSRITDEAIVTAVINILNIVIENQDLTDVDVPETTYTPNREVIRQQNEVRRMMENPSVDYERIKAEIYRLAELKYACCEYSDVPEKTAKLKSILSQTEKMNNLDIGLLKSCVCRILVSHFCTVGIEFINGVIINERGERT